MLNTFEKTKAHEARRAAIQRQMEAMENAANTRNISGGAVASGVGAQSSTTRRRGGADVSQSTNLETARRFLWDEDEDEAAESGRSFTVKSSKPETQSGSSVGVFASLGGLFGGNKPKEASSMPSSANRNIAAAQAFPESEHTTDTYRPSMLTSCYICFRRAMLRFALAIQSCFTWMRTRWSMAMGNGRGRKLCLLLSVILIIVIPVAIFVPGGSEAGGSFSSLSASQRYDLISKRIIQYGISDQDLLLKGNTPQNKALNWIVAEDPAQLDPLDMFLIPRYSLAVFYFSTHGEEMFQVATINITQTIPPAGSEQESGEAVLPSEGDTITMGDDLAAQPNWVAESGWLSGSGYCSWYGIECHHREGTSIYNTRYDANFGIILLNMTENNVRGKVPKEIFLANSDLRWFGLSGNGFFGTVPDEIGTNTGMRYLSLANNFFTGTVPQGLTDMSDLNRLYLDGNYFKGKLPKGIGRLQQLESLSIYNNYFTGTVPAEIGKLKNLTSLYMDVNHFTGTIPAEIGSLKEMNDLRLRHNYFVGTVPPELGDLPLLEILYLDRNTLTGTIPSSLAKATKLNEIHLYRNKLGGPIPTELGLLKELDSIYFDNNHLTGGIPTEFGNLKRVEQIYLHKNYMNGTIPTEIGNMESLVNLRIYTNGLVGTIPSEIGNAWKLENLYLQDNVISGTVPEVIGELTRLQKMRLYWNRLQGTIPKKICDLMEFKLTEFKTDCAGENPKVVCECCTACFA